MEISDSSQVKPSNLPLSEKEEEVVFPCHIHQQGNNQNNLPGKFPSFLPAPNPGIACPILPTYGLIPRQEYLLTYYLPEMIYSPPYPGQQVMPYSYPQSNMPFFLKPFLRSSFGGSINNNQKKSPPLAIMLRSLTSPCTLR
eukprot:TRINITY_DN9436_c0_g1_i2.p3 TRINITY_DN9436_c0_g1~~TRINITY_DN9436_c0_g1_i2.p3  ORF type:complete len:141 (-),score=6.96 TRINITY_DN9436_c0_g1_i2:335-757(-)